MTQAQQAALWRRYNSFRIRKTNQYIPEVNAALRQQLNHFATYRQVDFIPMQPIADVIKKVYMDAGKLWAHQSYLTVLSQAKERKSFTRLFETKVRMPNGFNDDFVNSILQYFQLRLLNDAVTPITKTTQEWIREQLNAGLQAGKGIDDIVQEILKSDITKQRAELIARTEVMKAAAYGEHLGAMKTGLRTNKIWISVQDHRTRHDHRDVDGQKQPDGKPFIVGAERWLMQRPGDSQSADGRRVPAKEICQCRCTVGREVLRGANGLPLRA